jgi:hydroxymethylbilane synthase
MKHELVMGTRGSALALAQARQIARRIEHANPGLVVREQVIRTTGDKQQGLPLPEIGGKGVFTLEIEQALLAKEIDFAVHSLKDLPPLFPEGLSLACVPERESPLDCCILSASLSSKEAGSADVWPMLPMGARVGTSSLRRAAQLKHARPDLHTESMRGNIDTRLRKLDESFDAVILARAGLNRLGVDLLNHAHFDLPASTCTPAPGQGALALEARTDDEETLQVLARVEHAATRASIEAERSCMEALGAGCSTPLGAYAQVEGETLSLHAVVLSIDGANRIEAQGEGDVQQAQVLGKLVAQVLVERGAREMMLH